jgi:hypothetical protein
LRIALLVALALAGCGAELDERNAGAGLGPAQQVEAIDQPATLPEELFELPELPAPEPAATDGCELPRIPEPPQRSVECDVSSDCFIFTKEGGELPCSPEIVARFRAEERERRAAMRPAPDSEPRAIARLGGVRLIAWRARSGARCTLADGGDGPQGGWTAYPPLVPFGPRCETDECAEICLGLGAGLTLAGLVSSRGDALRITFADAGARAYALTGPLVPGQKDRRVFMLELPDDASLHRVELLRDGKTIAEARSSAETLSTEEDDDGASWRHCPEPPTERFGPCDEQPLVPTTDTTVEPGQDPSGDPE